MRVLLDEHLPHRLKQLFEPSVVVLTVDRLGLIILLEAHSNRYGDLAPLMDSVNEILKRLEPGEIVRVRA